MSSLYTMPEENPFQRVGRSSRTPSPAPSTTPRSFSTARLASIPGPAAPSSSFKPVPDTFARYSSSRKTDESLDLDTPLAGIPISASQSGHRTSSLSQALRQSFGRSPPRFGATAGPTHAAEKSDVVSPLRRGHSPNNPRGRSPTTGNEDIETVRRHLAGPSKPGALLVSKQQPAAKPPLHHHHTSFDDGNDDDAHFSSLRLQGGDTTRHIYRYTEDRERELREEEERRAGKMKRSISMVMPPSVAADEDDDAEFVANIKKPGGLRREYIARTASPAASDRLVARNDMSSSSSSQTAKGRAPAPRFLANNFIEFLSLYGHFAGEELEEDDELLGPNEYFTNDHLASPYDSDEPGEESALLTPGRRARKRKERAAGKGTSTGAAMLLLKSFVGTGVLFLPRAFLNGGMLFSNLILLLVSGLSFWCFILLVNVRLQVRASFGDMGGQIYGDRFRNLINCSLVLSQVGFASAYIVFVSQNLQAFILAVTKCRTFIDIKYMILMQMVVFLPISLYRNINRIQKLALIADLFIALGLLYLYYYDIWTISENHGVSDITLFNPNDWTLFIGTAIFTFEGIGLIIPIQSGMKDPKRFPRVLAIVMVIVCLIYLSIGTLSYAAYGSSTKTVILLNMPQDSKMVNAVQFIYSLAILLSTPLQIYPAIEITSQQMFSRTGKYNPWIKWKKNIFRFLMVALCALIAWAGAADLDKFVALVGSFACVPLVFIYPPLMHYKVISRTTFQRAADLSLAVFGVLVMAYTTLLTVYNWLHAHRESSPGYCDEPRSVSAAWFTLSS